MESKESLNSATIFLLNKKDQEIGKQEVVFMPLTELKKRQVQKFGNTIRHSLKLDQCGIDHYQ